MLKIGNTLFRLRGIIGFIAFFILFFLSNPSNKTVLYSIPFILIGLILRFWASIYIGKRARTKTIMIDRIITEGPYKYFSHPLYLGNFFLTLGVLIALSPPLFLLILTIILFIIEYGIIARTESSAIREHLSISSAKCIVPNNSAQVHKSIVHKSGVLVLLCSEIWTLLYLLLIYLLIIYRSQS